jgi:hypothetical protein
MSKDRFFPIWVTTGDDDDVVCRGNETPSIRAAMEVVKEKVDSNHATIGVVAFLGHKGQPGAVSQHIYPPGARKHVRQWEDILEWLDIEGDEEFEDTKKT